MAGTRRPGRLDIEVIQGTDWTLPLRVKDTVGALLDLSGWSGLAQIRDEAAMAPGAPPTLSISVNVGSFGSGADAYNVELHIGRAVSSALGDSFGKGRWDLELSDPFGNRARILEGQATLSREVTV